MSEYIDCRDYGAFPNGSNDTSAGLNAAFAAANTALLPLVILPGSYNIYNPLVWVTTSEIDIIAYGATLLWHESGVALTYGAANGQIYVCRILGLSVDLGSGSPTGKTGIVIRNTYNAEIELEKISNMDIGFQFVADGRGAAYNRLKFMTDNCNTGFEIQLLDGNNGWSNVMKFHDCRIKSNNGQIMISVPFTESYYKTGLWEWDKCSFEGNGTATWIDGQDINGWIFKDCSFTSNPAGSLIYNAVEDWGIDLRGGNLQGFSDAFISSLPITIGWGKISLVEQSVTKYYYKTNASASWLLDEEGGNWFSSWDNNSDHSPTGETTKPNTGDNVVVLGPTGPTNIPEIELNSFDCSHSTIAAWDESTTANITINSSGFIHIDSTLTEANLKWYGTVTDPTVTVTFGTLNSGLDHALFSAAPLYNVIAYAGAYSNGDDIAGHAYIYGGDIAHTVAIADFYTGYSGIAKLVSGEVTGLATWHNTTYWENTNGKITDAAFYDTSRANQGAVSTGDGDFYDDTVCNATFATGSFDDDSTLGPHGRIVGTGAFSGNSKCAGLCGTMTRGGIVYYQMKVSTAFEVMDIVGKRIRLYGGNQSNINADEGPILSAGQILRIIGSTTNPTNDGLYTVVSSAFVSNKQSVYVSEDFPGGDEDGSDVLRCCRSYPLLSAGSWYGGVVPTGTQAGLISDAYIATDIGDINTIYNFYLNPASHPDNANEGVYFGGFLTIQSGDNYANIYVPSGCYLDTGAGTNYGCIEEIAGSTINGTIIETSVSVGNCD